VADAWARHDFAEVVRGERVAVAVPGVRRASAAPAEQVAAVLSGYVRGAEELGVTVVTAQVLGDGAGYVELERRYRPAGAGEEIRDRILLSYRGGAGGWHLVELLIQRA
jgi:hypothetical protein